MTHSIRDLMTALCAIALTASVAMAGGRNAPVRSEAPAKTAAAGEKNSKGLKSWMKTLKERFLRRCQNPWAPDPAPSPAPAQPE